jgi:hypothetical protein
VPLKLRIIPFFPTANTLFAVLPHTAIRSGRGGCCICQSAGAAVGKPSRKSRKLNKIHVDRDLVTLPSSIRKSHEPLFPLTIE